MNLSKPCAYQTPTSTFYSGLGISRSTKSIGAFIDRAYNNLLFAPIKQWIESLLAFHHNNSMAKYVIL